MYQIQTKMNLKTAVFILFLFHVSGLVAILFTPFSDLFLSLTPLNLLVSTFLVFHFHGKISRLQTLSFVVIALAGFGIEALGVATGKIFGVYQYGPVLGWKIFETPLMIGINWILLSYSMTYTWSRLFQNKWLIAFISAISLVVLDVLIEPVAIFYNLWRWESDVVPLQNFLVWGIIAFVFCSVLAQTKKDSNNPLTPYLILAQTLFFGILYLFS